MAKTINQLKYHYILLFYVISMLYNWIDNLHKKSFKKCCTNKL